jgi:predicted nuclease with TOPRIM domain
MLDKLFSLFPTYQKRIEKLEKENAELKEKLAKRQEDINKTNAYWKKKLAGIVKPKPSSK